MGVAQRLVRGEGVLPKGSHSHCDAIMKKGPFIGPFVCCKRHKSRTDYSEA